MRAELISVGDELVRGLTVDTNSAWLARALADAGVEVARHATVADDVEVIAVALRSAWPADLVIVTGGLGPTPDDLTREALARFLGTKLEAHDAALASIRAFFAARGREMPPDNEAQSLVPEFGKRHQRSPGSSE